MKCIECGKNAELKEKTYVANLDSCVIVIKNVPAYVCDCGEVYYSDEVFEEIEQIIFKLKDIINDVAVVDYMKQTA